MKLMHAVRPNLHSSKLRPDTHFIRTIQVPGGHAPFDAKTQRYKLSSQAFRPSSVDRSLSGDLEQLLLDDGLTATTLYPGIRRAVGAVQLDIGTLLSLNLRVEHEKIKENWYHGSVYNITDNHKKKLQKACKTLIEIDQELAREYDLQRQAEAAALQTAPTQA